jgi:hypothetical protein
MKLLNAAITLALFSSVVSHQAHAQTVPRFEVGGQVFSNGSRDLGYGYGAGGRFTYNFKNYLALDTEIGAFQSDEGRTYASQGFIGAKVGKRTRYFGAFVKARPGYSTFFVVNDDSRAKPRFVVDIGGVLKRTRRNTCCCAWMWETQFSLWAMLRWPGRGVSTDQRQLIVCRSVWDWECDSESSLASRKSNGFRVT